MKTSHALVVFALGCVLFATNSFAQSVPSVREITQQIIKSVNAYVNAISCSASDVGPKQIAALVPMTYDGFSYEGGRYAVLWEGSFDCGGNSGSSRDYVAIVEVTYNGRSFNVVPSMSSPVIQFESPVRYIDRIVGNTRDSMILEGWGYGPNDSTADGPSVRARFTMRVDEQGNWKPVEQLEGVCSSTGCTLEKLRARALQHLD